MTVYSELALHYTTLPYNALHCTAQCFIQLNCSAGDMVTWWHGPVSDNQSDTFEDRQCDRGEWWYGEKVTEWHGYRETGWMGQRWECRGVFLSLFCWTTPQNRDSDKQCLSVSHISDFLSCLICWEVVSAEQWLAWQGVKCEGDLYSYIHMKGFTLQSTKVEVFYTVP